MNNKLDYSYPSTSAWPFQHLVCADDETKLVNFLMRKKFELQISWDKSEKKFLNLKYFKKEKYPMNNQINQPNFENLYTNYVW